MWPRRLPLALSMLVLSMLVLSMLALVVRSRLVLAGGGTVPT
jgi:hypothetical protein